LKIDNANPFNILSQLKFEDEDYKQQTEDPLTEERKTVNGYPGLKVRIWLEKKHRNGKAVSLITGLQLPIEELKLIAKKIKSKLGVGGSFSENTIIIQSQNRDEILKFLLSEGFTDIKKAGG
jgi:translation initiation factor 1